MPSRCVCCAGTESGSSWPAQVGTPCSWVNTRSTPSMHLIPQACVLVLGLSAHPASDLDASTHPIDPLHLARYPPPPPPTLSCHPTTPCGSPALLSCTPVPPCCPAALFCTHKTTAHARGGCLRPAGHPSGARLAGGPSGHHHSSSVQQQVLQRARGDAVPGEQNLKIEKDHVEKRN